MHKMGWIALTAAIGLGLAQPASAFDNDNAAIIVTAEHQRDWSRGQQMERDGIENLARAERRLGDAQQLIERGESRSTDARRRLDSARTEYRQLAGSLDASADSTTAVRHSRAMRTAAERWSGAEERLDDGDELLRDGRNRLQRAENERDEARQRIERGLALKTRAERASAVQNANLQ